MKKFLENKGFDVMIEIADYKSGMLYATDGKMSL